MHQHDEALETLGRITRSKAEAQRFYDGLSRWYDWLAGGSEGRFKRRGLDLLAPAPGERVLEIGAGTGGCSVEMARRVGAEGVVHGLDLSPGMLAVAGDKARAARLEPRIRLTLGDATRLPYAASVFDALFSSFTLELLDAPEIGTMLAECRRVLKPGGRLCIVSLDRPPRPGWMSRLYVRVHRRFPRLADCRPIPVADCIEAAGLRLREVEHYRMWGLPVAVVLAQVEP